jgi:protein-disulfide isomerase
MTDAPRLHRRAALTGLAALGLAAAAPARLVAEPKLLLGVQFLGAEDAPVQMIEYVSLTCPHCARFHIDVYPEIKRDYIETGKVRLEFREVYFDRVGLWAAMLARCGGEDRYFGFISLLLEKQEQWSRSDDLMGEFKRLGRQGGLSDAEVEACLTDADGQRALVEMYQQYYEDPRLTGTPTLIVDGEKVENPFRDLRAAIDAALGS